VICWGEAYSTPEALDLPVTIAFEPAPSMVEIAVVDSAARSTPWKEDCLVHRGCTLAPSGPLSPCPRDTVARDWADILPNLETLAGQIVRVRGSLGVGQIRSTKMGCPAGRCCNRASGPVVLGTPEQPLGLQGLFCNGDQSRTCCNAPAYGQTVVASGRLQRGMDAGAGMPQWSLAQPTLCSDDAP
jgi:hypothetical protein